MSRLGHMGVHQQGTAPAERLSMRGTVAAVSCNDAYSFTKPVRAEIVLIAGLGVAGDVHAGVTVRHRSRVAADPDQPNLRQVHLIGSELHDELGEADYAVPAGGLGENVTTAGIDLLALPVGTILRFGPAPTAADSDSAADSAPAGPAPAGLGMAGPAGGAAAVVAAADRVTLDDSAANAVAALAAHLAAEETGRAHLAAEEAGRAHLGAEEVGRAHLAAEQAGRAHLGAEQAGRVQLAAEQAVGPLTGPAIFITGLRNPCQQINHYRPGLLKRVLNREADGSLSRRAGVMAVVLRGGPIRPGAEIHVELPAGPHRPLDRV